MHALFCTGLLKFDSLMVQERAERRGEMRRERIAVRAKRRCGWVLLLMLMVMMARGDAEGEERG